MSHYSLKSYVKSSAKNAVRPIIGPYTTDLAFLGAAVDYVLARTVIISKDLHDFILLVKCFSWF
jgi:hypothetical protein